MYQTFENVSASTILSLILRRAKCSTPAILTSSKWTSTRSWITLDNIGCFIKELEAEADVCSKQAEKFEKRATHARNKARQLREYVSTFCGGEKIRTDRCEFRWRKSEQVTIISEDVIPEKYKKVKTVETVDKTAVKKALKAGEIVVGASLTTKQNLQLG